MPEMRCYYKKDFKAKTRTNKPNLKPHTDDSH